MEDEERTVASNTEKAIQKECQLFQEEQNREERASGDLASVIATWCNNLFDKQNDSEHNEQKTKEGVLNGTIPTTVADSGTTSSVGALKDTGEYEPTGLKSNKIFKVANGQTEAATDIKLLQHPLRKDARQVNIVPGIKTASLLSTGTLADNGYISIFDKEEVLIFDATNTEVVTTRGAVLKGWRTTDGLYRIPLVPNVSNVNSDTILCNKPPTEMLKNRPPPSEAIHNVYELRSQAEIIRYFHAAAGFPTKSTWLKAIKKGFYASWPGLTVTAARKHFPESEETQKGHMKKQKTGIRSTKKQLIQPSSESDMSEPRPPQSKKKDVMIKILDTCDELQMKIFSDQTGRFPKRSCRGYQYIMVLCEIDSDAILVEPMRNRTAGEMIRAYQVIINRLRDAGIQPKQHILDNECSAEFKEAIKNNGMTHQLVPPNDHRRNHAERAIQTFKAHFISILCGVDDNFPISLWCRLLPQAEMTLNLLRPSRTTPNVSAYAHLFHQHDYNQHPLAPLGMAVEMHVVPDIRETFAPHSASGFNVGTSFEHYRCYIIYISETKSTRIGNTVFFKHKYLTMPTMTNSDALLKAAQDMTTALKGGVQQSNEQADAIKILMKIFKNNATTMKEMEEATRPQRVKMRDALEQRVNMERDKINSQEEKEVAPVAEPSLAPTFFETIEPNNDVPAHNTRSRTMRTITQEALLTTLTKSAASVTITAQSAASRKYPLALLTEMAGAVLDAETGELLEYRHLIKKSKYKKTWNNSFGDEISRLAQGRKDGSIKGTDTFFFINKHQVPQDRFKDVAYDRVVCMVRPEKADPNRTRVTAAPPNNFNPHCDVGTPTADLVTVKLLLNSIISTPDARCMCIDIKNFYLNTPLDRYEYMKMKLSKFPDDIIEEYKLRDKVTADGYVYVEIRRGIYGLPASGILSQQLLEKRLKKKGYSQSKFTPGLWTHEWRPICFSLVVDDFCVKYVGKEHAQHLLNAIKDDYECTADWQAERYLGLTLDWDYTKKEVHLSMPGYVAEGLKRFKHPPPTKPQNQPHKHAVPIYGQKVQYSPVDESPPIGKEDETFIQQVTGTFLYYARAVDPTMLVALSSIASAQANPTEETMERCKLFLDYAATHPDAIITYRASEMVLAVHSDASYLIEPKARSRAGGHFFMSNNTPHPPNNGSVLNVAQIIKAVMTSAAEAEMGALYINAREAIPMRTTLIEMGHKQPPTPLQTDNTTALGVISNNIRKRQSKAWDMRMFWLRDREAQEQFRFYWRPGPHMRADYLTKHFSSAHHQNERPEWLTPVKVLRALRAQLGKAQPVFTDSERVC